MISCLFFLIIPPLMLFGYQSILEAKGINDPTLAISLFKTGILLDASLKLLLVGFITDVDAYALIGIYALLGFFLFFWIRLTLNIPKSNQRKNRKYPQETNYTLCAFNVLGWGIASIAFNFILLTAWTFEEPFEIIYICTIMAAMTILALALGASALIRLDRLKYPSIRSLKALAHNNSPIVLLRSFKIDAYPTMNGRVFDESICCNLDLEKNPIISLANPDEILPSGGSLKIQAKDAQWQEAVKEILRNCRAVILVEGLSDGLHWEISKLKEYLNPSQLFVMIPPKEYRELAWCYNENAGEGLYSIMRNLNRLISRIVWGNKKERKRILADVWDDFTSRLNQFGIHTPHSYPGDSRLLYFDDEWNGKILEDIHDTKAMLDYIVSRTTTFNQSDFDYPSLGEKIASYEVNGFLDEAEVAPFKKLVDQCNRLGRIAALSCFAIFVLIILFI